MRLVLAKTLHALAAVAEQRLNVSLTGLGDSDFRVLEVLSGLSTLRLRRTRVRNHTLDECRAIPWHGRLIL